MRGAKTPHADAIPYHILSMLSAAAPPRLDVTAQRRSKETVVLCRAAITEPARCVHACYEEVVAHSGAKHDARVPFYARRERCAARV